MNLVVNAPTAEGMKLGKELARLIEPEIKKLEYAGKPDDRCASCAYREGTYPNGCATTLMDAVKCSMEGIPFRCHERPEKMCWGHVAAVKDKATPRTSMPWPFSDEV